MKMARTLTDMRPMMAHLNWKLATQMAVFKGNMAILTLIVGN